MYEEKQGSKESSCNRTSSPRGHSDRQRVHTEYMKQNITELKGATGKPIIIFQHSSPQ